MLAQFPLIHSDLHLDVFSVEKYMVYASKVCVLDAHVNKP